MLTNVCRKCSQPLSFQSISCLVAVSFLRHPIWWEKHIVRTSTWFMRVSVCVCVHVIACVFSSCVMESGVVDMQAKSLTFLALFLQYPNPLFKLRCPLQWSLGPLVSLNTTFTVLPNSNLAPLPSSPSLPSVPS